MCAPVPKNKWAWHWECCINCGTTRKDGKHIHKGKGLCLSCWDKKRAKDPKRIAYSKINRVRHYEEFKQKPNYKDLIKQHQKEWRLKYPNHYRAMWHRRNLKQKFVRFIRDGRWLKKYEHAIRFHCENCEEIIQTCILPDYSNSAETSKTGRELRIFKKVHEKFCQKKVRNIDGFIKI